MFPGRDPARSEGSFTKIDLCVLLSILGLLTAIQARRLHATSQSTLIKQCLNNQKNIGLAFRIWSTDCGDDFPFERSTNNGGSKELTTTAAHFLVLSNELSAPQTIVCPDSRRQVADNWAQLQDANVSYFIGLEAAETYPQTVLGGDSGFTVNGSLLPTNRFAVTKDSFLAYPASVHKTKGGILFADGSVSRLNPRTWDDVLRKQELGSNVFLVPKP